MAREFDDIWGLALCCNREAIGYYASGKFEDAIASLEQAVELFRRSGDQWELNLANFHLACCHYRLGNLATAWELARSTFESSLRIGDTRTHCCLGLMSRTVIGSLPFDRLASRFCAVPEEILPMSNLVVGRAIWQLGCGKAEEAIDTLTPIWKRARENLLVNFHTLGALVWLVAALRTRAAELNRVDANQAVRLRRRALRLAKWAVRFTRIMRPDHAHALRELSRLYAAEGNLRKAVQVADKSCTVAKAQKATYEYAQSLRFRGELAQQLGQPDAEQQIHSAEETLEAFARIIAKLESDFTA
jgi:two-component system sensor kinase